MRVVETEWEGESVTILTLRDITERKISEQHIQNHLDIFTASLDLRVTLNVFLDYVLPTSWLLMPPRCFY